MIKSLYSIESDTLWLHPTRDGHSKNEEIKSRKTNLKGEGVNGKITMTQTQDITVLHLECTSCTLSNMGLSLSMPAIVAGFVLKSKSENSGQKKLLSANTQNICYTPEKETICPCNSTPLDCVFVLISPEWFAQHISMEIPGVSDFSKEIRFDKHVKLHTDPAPITSAIHLILRDILSCKRKGIFKKAYLENKIAEVLLLQFEQHYTGLTKTSKGSYSEKILAAKEIIDANYQHPCSLLDLAHQVGTNDFTLKKGFKEMFGTTVFGYINALKMERARRMLEEEDKTINEIAASIGYKNATHFTAAFKKKYGIVPKDLKT